MCMFEMYNWSHFKKTGLKKCSFSKKITKIDVNLLEFAQ